jgi:hypothetical protein
MRDFPLPAPAEQTERAEPGGEERERGGKSDARLVPADAGVNVKEVPMSEERALMQGITMRSKHIVL